MIKRVLTEPEESAAELYDEFHRASRAIATRREDGQSPSTRRNVAQQAGEDEKTQLWVEYTCGATNGR